MNRGLIATLVLLLSVPGAMAQDDPLEPGRQAFRDGRYERAIELFGQAASAHPDLAEAHFLISRVYFETELFDEGKARSALQKALELEPENVEFLVARLEQYRVESWNFLGDRMREARRLETARDILQIDPENAYAHEELGRVYIRDFWRYRNAVMMPHLSYGYSGGTRLSDAPTYQDELPTFDDLLGGAPDPITSNFAVIDPNQVFLGDRFDLETLKSQGVDIVDLSERAESAYRRAIAHLQKALEVDPRRRSVYDELMQVYALKGEFESSMVALNEMFRFYPEDADLWRYLGLANYRLGNMEAADRSFNTAFEYMERGVAAAYTDLGLFLTREEKDIEAVDSIAYRARYWTSQDPRFLTAYNERKLEHYARLTYADLLYGSKALGLRGWDTERGQILIRYGAPPVDVVLHPQEDGIFTAREAVVGAMVNSLTAQGNLDTGELPAEVVGSQSFDTVYSTARQAFEQMNAYNIWDYGDFRFVFEDPFRNGEYRLYSPSAEDMAQEFTAYMNDYITLTREIIRETPQRYEYEAPGRQIELPFLVTSFKGTGAQTDIFVHYGVPLVAYDENSELIDITANSGIFLVDERRDILVERRRTLYGLPTRQVMTFAEQLLWVDTQSMQAPAGEHELSVEFETASGQTVAVQRRPITVPDFADGSLALSDLMLAYSVEEIDPGQTVRRNEVVRDGLAIQPAPWSVYSTNWPIYLYFEIYGLATNAEGSTDYDVEITLAPKETRTGVRRVIGGLLRRTPDGVSVSYHGSGTRPDEALYQILDASQQDMGLYTLTLRVEDNVSGEERKRTQDLFLEL